MAHKAIPSFSGAMMILRADAARSFDIPLCHGGPGVLRCTDYLAGADVSGGQIMLVHDDRIPPGSGVGEHLHTGDEELYVVLEGSGTMTIDGSPEKIGPGDICLTRSGHRHGLLNTGGTPMRLLVVGVRPVPAGQSAC